MNLVKFALIGAGRIGKMHASNIFLNKKCKIETIYDKINKNAKDVSKLYGGNIAKSAREAITNPKVNAVFISSATPTHIDYILQAAKAGKAIFCEKPIDLNIKKVKKCEKELKKYKVPLQIGFNRRFDPSHKKAIKRKNNGEIGKLEKIIITSRDLKPSSASYFKDSGGMFRDMTIHDFDMTRFILNKDPIIEIFAMGERLFSKEAKEAKDIDTAMIIMKSKSGVLCHINNSRHSAYGHDQRIELFGSNGMIISENQTNTSIKRFSNKFTESKDTILDFFIERYEMAYKLQLNEFVNNIINKKKISTTFEDGKCALMIANAAYQSLSTKKIVKIKF